MIFRNINYYLIISFVFVVVCLNVQPNISILIIYFSKFYWNQV